MLEVRNVVFSASFLDDFADGRIVNVGNVWEKVVFHLEI
jgi:predicted ester cyclase